MNTINDTATTTTANDTTAPAADLNTLFAEYDAANAAYLAAKAAVDAAYAAQSAVVQRIANVVPGKKVANGKISKSVVRKGVGKLTIVQRGEIFFFRGAADTSDLPVVG